MINWQELATISHYQTAVAVQHELQRGHIYEATAGIQELIDALSRSEKRALKSQLIRLMAHIIKWKTQPHKRSRSWIATIYNAREEIADIQEDTPSLSDDVIRDLWDRCFRAAKREADAEMNQKSRINHLSWEDVFEEQYEDMQNQ